MSRGCAPCAATSRRTSSSPTSPSSPNAAGRIRRRRAVVASAAVAVAVAVVTVGAAHTFDRDRTQARAAAGPDLDRTAAARVLADPDAQVDPDASQVDGSRRPARGRHGARRQRCLRSAGRLRAPRWSGADGGSRSWLERRRPVVPLVDGFVLGSVPPACRSGAPAETRAYLVDGSGEAHGIAWEHGAERCARPEPADPRCRFDVERARRLARRRRPAAAGHRARRDRAGGGAVGPVLRRTSPVLVGRRHVVAEPHDLAPRRLDRERDGRRFVGSARRGHLGGVHLATRGRPGTAGTCRRPCAACGSPTSTGPSPGPACSSASPSSWAAATSCSAAPTRPGRASSRRTCTRRSAWSARRCRGDAVYVVDDERWAVSTDDGATWRRTPALPPLPLREPRGPSATRFLCRHVHGRREMGAHVRLVHLAASLAGCLAAGGCSGGAAAPGPTTARRSPRPRPRGLLDGRPPSDRARVAGLASGPPGPGPPGRGVRHHQQRRARRPGRAPGVDDRPVLRRARLPDRGVRGRRGPARVAVAPASRPRAGAADVRGPRATHGRGALADGTLVPTTGWAPGLYVFKLRASSGWQAQVPYVVTSPSARDRVALVFPVTTWQAYNDWGGYSLYEGARRRPAQLGRQLRPSLSGPRRDGDGVRGRAGRRRRRTPGDPAGLPHEHRPRPASRCPRRGAGLRVVRPRRVLVPGDARPGRAGPGDRDQPRVPGCEHDVLARPPGAWRTRRRRLPQRRGARPRATLDPHGAVARGRPRRPREQADRDGVRVLPRRRAVPGGLAAAGGASRARAPAAARSWTTSSVSRRTASIPCGGRLGRCRCSRTVVLLPRRAHLGRRRSTTRRRRERPCSTSGRCGGPARSSTAARSR